jgi:hypothetical protein
MEPTKQAIFEVSRHNDSNQDVFDGHLATSLAGNRTRILVEKPTILSLVNLAMSQLLVRLEPVGSARGYQVQVSGAGGWLDAGVYSQDGRIVLGNLMPGASYKVRARALGSSSGFSEWSDSLSLDIS